jgi:amino acid transporter
VAWLFALGFLLPAYTITGFDASAHAAEETVHAARNVPRGIVRSVLVSGVFGWLLLCAVVLAMKNPAVVAGKGEHAFSYTLRSVLPDWFATLLFIGIILAQYLCGLATITSASRMAFAFARDGGLPGSSWVRYVSPHYRTPTIAVWGVSIASVLFTVYSPVYGTISAVCVIFLYVSYVLPTAIGLIAYGRWWKDMGPWHLGVWFRPLAVVSVLGCAGLIVIGMQPPYEQAAYVLAGALAALAILWFTVARRTFAGPPQGMSSASRLKEIETAEAAVHEDAGKARRS